MTPERMRHPPEGLPRPFREWWEDHVPEIQSATSAEKNGHIPTWNKMLEDLPLPTNTSNAVCNDAVVWDGTEDLMDRNLWMKLHPWRKGPYQFGKLFIDTEWRSDWKWDRLADVISPLTGKTCLDVGCGNGYHLWRMRGAGAKYAIGVDPFLLYVFQFYAIQKRMQDPNVHVLPLGTEHLDRYMGVDTIFSMGVLYHAADPLQHLSTLLNTVRPGGQLVLETLIVPDSEGPVLSIHGRYAKMRNIRVLPTATTLIQWVQEAGWKHARIEDVTLTTLQEQRATDWMTFHSLEQFLDPEDASRTIEGFPAPGRCLLLAEKEN